MEQNVDVTIYLDDVNTASKCKYQISNIFLTSFASLTMDV